MKRIYFASIYFDHILTRKINLKDCYFLAKFSNREFQWGSVPYLLFYVDRESPVACRRFEFR